MSKNGFRIALLIEMNGVVDTISLDATSKVQLGLTVIGDLELGG